MDLVQFSKPADSPKDEAANQEEEYEEAILNWPSVAFLYRVYYQTQYSNDGLNSKLRDIVIAKRDIDPVEFESASILLSVLTSKEGPANKEVIESVVNGVYNQLAEEGSAMFSQFDGRNVASFLNTMIKLGKKEENKRITEEFIDYFSGLIKSDKIVSKIELEDFNSLLKVFEDAKTVGNVDPLIFEHIKKRVQFINERREKGAGSI